MTSTAPVTLKQYERAERTIAHEEEQKGLAVHTVVTVLVSVALVAINIWVAPQFPWSPFPVVGMCIGLAVHWWFGWRKLDDTLTHRQEGVEARARSLR